MLAQGTAAAGDAAWRRSRRRRRSSEAVSPQVDVDCGTAGAVRRSARRPWAPVAPSSAGEATRYARRPSARGSCPRNGRHARTAAGAVVVGLGHREHVVARWPRNPQHDVEPDLGCDAHPARIAGHLRRIVRSRCRRSTPAAPSTPGPRTCQHVEVGPDVLEAVLLQGELVSWHVVPQSPADPLPSPRKVAAMATQLRSALARAVGRACASAWPPSACHLAPESYHVHAPLTVYPDGEQVEVPAHIPLNRMVCAQLAAHALHLTAWCTWAPRRTTRTRMSCRRSSPRGKWPSTRTAWAATSPTTTRRCSLYLHGKPTSPAQLVLKEGDDIVVAYATEDSFPKLLRADALQRA